MDSKPKPFYIFFDTNVLLDLYSYSEETIKSILKGLESISPPCEFIIPKRAYEEFLNTYRSCRDKKRGRNNLVSYSNKFEECIRIIHQKLDSLPKIDEMYDCSISPLFEEQKKQLESFRNSVNKEIDNIKNETIPSFDDNNDLVFDFVQKHKPNSLLTTKDKLDISIWGEQRIKLDLKPGRKDYKEKKGFNKFGDIYIWKEILDSPEALKRCYFITNESKDDWWKEQDSDEFDPFLIEEFKELHPNTEFKAFHFSDFCLHFSSHFTNSALEEISSLRTKFLEALEDKKIIKLVSDNIYGYNYHSIEDSLLLKEVRGGNIERVDDLDILDIDDSGESELLNTSVDDVEQLVIAQCVITVKGTANVSIRYYADAYDYFTIDFKSTIRVGAFLTIEYNPDVSLAFNSAYSIDCLKTEITEDREFVPDQSYYR